MSDLRQAELNQAGIERFINEKCGGLSNTQCQTAISNWLTQGDQRALAIFGGTLALGGPSAIRALISAYKVGKEVWDKPIPYTLYDKLRNIDSKQLQAKFKHAEDFGVSGNYNTANALRFQEAINRHIRDPLVRIIQGTYRGQPVTHIVNPQTGLSVITTRSGEFISGWKLNPAQLRNVLSRGGL